MNMGMAYSEMLEKLERTQRENEKRLIKEKKEKEKQASVVELAYTHGLGPCSVKD
jgi:hypothetical protein